MNDNLVRGAERNVDDPVLRWLEYLRVLLRCGESGLLSPNDVGEPANG